MSFITPIIKCKTELPGIDLFIKREDLLPYSFGGNKVRIAQEFFADMDTQKKNCMIGYGNVRSNLSRALANISASRGNKCFIISPADDNGERIETGNSRIVDACGAEFRFCTKQNVADTVDSVMEEARRQGFRPYYIYGNHYGEGNEAVPIRAYVKVYDEIRRQEKNLGIKFDHIFLAVGTGMTQGGLVAGQRKLGGSEEIVGISIARDRTMVQEAIKKSICAYEKKHSDDLKINVSDAYLCGGYGNYGNEIREIIRTMMVQNGVPLDPVYTGKAFWGMCDYIRSKDIENKSVLFIHTGGTPLFFDQIDLLKSV